MKQSSSWIAVLPSLVIPVCIGLMMYLGLSYLIQEQVIANEAVLRYLTGHPVSKVTVAMFFIGTASLALIGKNVFEQYRAERKITIKSPSNSSTSSETQTHNSNSNIAQTAIDAGNQLKKLPGWMHEHYLWQRLANGLHSIYQSKSTAGINDELKHLSELDLEHQQQRYSLASILIWATPMLGFLGTVLGISQALGGINVGPDNDFQTMMNGLRGSLYVAFDTTALALTLSMIMMFGRFFVERFETQLLTLVDQRTKHEIGGRFDLSTDQSQNDYHDLTDQLLSTIQKSAEQQTKIWRTSIQAAQDAWVASLSQTNLSVQNSLSDAIGESVSDLAHYLGESIEKADQAMANRWGQWQVTLSDNARLLSEHQQRLTEQSDLLTQVIEKANDRSVLEAAIAHNEAAVAATTNLQNTIEELTTAVANLKPEPAAEPETISVEKSYPTPSPDAEVILPRPRRHTNTGGPATIKFEAFYDPKSTKQNKRNVDRDATQVLLPFKTLTKRTAAPQAHHPSKKAA